MDDFLQDKPHSVKRKTSRSKGWFRVFLLVFSVSVLWQTVSFLQIQLCRYHQALRDDFKVILSVSQPVDNTVLASWGESLSTKKDITAVKLFSPQDALAVLKGKNPHLVQSLVSLGRDPMPAYFEIKLTDRALNNIQSFMDNLSVEYPQLSVRYSQTQAQWAFYSGLCLQVVNVAVVFCIIIFFIFMFLVEAHPSQYNMHLGVAAMAGIAAAALSLGFLILLVYPTGYLAPALEQFTSLERQAALCVFGGLFGWTLSKWKKF